MTEVDKCTCVLLTGPVSTELRVLQCGGLEMMLFRLQPTQRTNARALIYQRMRVSKYGSNIATKMDNVSADRTHEHMLTNGH